MVFPDLQIYNIIKKLRYSFDTFGYVEIFLNSIERFDKRLSDGIPFVYNNELYLINPDITSILRTKNLKNNTRIFYVYEALNKYNQSTLKAGIEFVNNDELRSNEEILRILINTMEGMGIYDFNIDISLSNIFIDRIGKKNYERVKPYIIDGNIMEIQNMDIDELSKREVIDLINGRGKESDITFLNDLRKNLNDPRIIIDTGTVRYMNYYDGLIFEVYSSNYFIGAGGNYRIKNKNACGFSVDIESLAKILKDDKK